MINHDLKHMLTAPYHPATNVQPESYVRTLKRGLNALVLESGTLQMKLSNFILQSRKMHHVSTTYSPQSLYDRVLGKDIFIKLLMLNRRFL